MKKKEGRKGKCRVRARRQTEGQTELRRTRGRQKCCYCRLSLHEFMSAANAPRMGGGAAASAAAAAAGKKAKLQIDGRHRQGGREEGRKEIRRGRSLRNDSLSRARAHLRSVRPYARRGYRNRSAGVKETKANSDRPAHHHQFITHEGLGEGIQSPIF